MSEDLPEEWPQEAKDDFRECNDCEEFVQISMIRQKQKKRGLNDSCT